MPCISDRKELLNDLNSVSSLLVIRLKLKKETIPPSILPYWTIATNLACAIQNGLQTNTEKFKRSWLFFFIIYLSKRMSSEQFQPPLLQSKEGVQLLQFLGLVNELTHQRYLNPRIHCQRIASRDRTFNTLFNSKVEIFIRWKSTGTRIAPTPCGFSSLWPVGNGGAIAMLSEVFNVSEGSIENFTNRTLQAILDLEDRYVKLPTPQERVAMIDSLPKDDIFRNCVGFVDGTIIPLESAPTKNKEDYWMRKTLYALNSLLVCDRNKRIIYSFHGWCGSAHDQRVYKNSRFLLADSAYTATDTVVPAFKR
ncbi:hypothetical protein PSTT_06177 [Puccinia striiformis]|uniref:DDE Tnp4 domain-containing protein n=1 Tax=Puccinia striiformis TaxID=27350 RepID=A0A2S4VLG6_9BASI|nr:hypothetical protein PSTT_06177 [Puccinia striiformis]